MFDKRAVNEYLSIIGEKKLSLNLFDVLDIKDNYPVERMKEFLSYMKGER